MTTLYSHVRELYVFSPNQYQIGSSISGVTGTGMCIGNGSNLIPEKFSIGTENILNAGGIRSVIIGNYINASYAASDMYAVGHRTVVTNAQTFAIGNPDIDIQVIPVVYNSPFTHFRTHYTYTGTQDFSIVASNVAAAPVCNGVIRFDIGANATMKLPTPQAFWAQFRKHAVGSYMWGYVYNNASIGSATLSITAPTGVTITGITSLPAWQGVWFIIQETQQTPSLQYNIII